MEDRITEDIDIMEVTARDITADTTGNMAIMDTTAVTDDITEDMEDTVTMVAIIKHMDSRFLRTSCK